MTAAEMRARASSLLEPFVTVTRHPSIVVVTSLDEDRANDLAKALLDAADAIEHNEILLAAVKAIEARTFAPGEKESIPEWHAMRELMSQALSWRKPEVTHGR